MMFDYSANPIFLNKKKIKIGHPEHLLHPPTLSASSNISILALPPLPHPPQSERHMSITPSPVSLNRYIQVFCMWIITEAKKHVPSAVERLRAKNTTLISFLSSLHLLLGLESKLYKMLTMQTYPGYWLA